MTTGAGCARSCPRARRWILALGWTAASVALVGVAACSADGSGAGSDVSVTSGSDGSDPMYLERPEQVPDLLYAQFGEVPRFTRLSLTNSDLTVELRDPDIPDNLDLWRWSDGEWTSSPVSVSQSEIDALDTTTFGPDAITWSAIPGLIRQAYDGVDLEEEHIDSVSFDRIAGDPPRVYIGISGLRGSGSLLAAADGTDVQVRRN